MADRQPPLLSLVVPVYGVEDYIADCLDSILAARGFHEVCELIIVDDGSPDNSMAIVEERCAGLSNVIILRQANAGLGAARNTGLAHACGRYIWFVDSDDEIDSASIDVLKGYIELFSPEILAFEFETIGGTLKRPHYLDIYDRSVAGVDFLISGRPPSPVQFYAYARAFLVRTHAQFYTGIYHEDALFNALALTRADSLVRLRHACYRYRLRSGSIMSLSNPEKHLIDMLHIAKLLSAEAQLDRQDARVRKALGREIGFTLAAIRHYAARTTPSNRRNIVSLAQLLSLGWHWFRTFPPRVLINYFRLLALFIFHNKARS